MSAPARAAVARESDVAARWARGIAGPLRLEDGRILRVIFPGVPGGSSGPDFRGAILDAGGDILRGDVEVHLLASGWKAHGHASDDAYGAVVLHVVARNDGGTAATTHQSGRAIPILVLRSGTRLAGEGFSPPCVFGARERAVGPLLARMGGRRLRAKVARVEPLVASVGAGQALYALLLEYLAGSANRAAFGSVARTLPLRSLLERITSPGASRGFAAAAELKGVAAPLALRRAGLRPMATPGRRLEAAGALVALLWPAGAEPEWPGALSEMTSTELVRLLGVEGVGRASAVELVVNAVLPVGVAAGELDETRALELLESLPTPGTYGRLKQLEGWLGVPFGSAAGLQGGLLLHDEYCTRGRCGRCPFSS